MTFLAVWLLLAAQTNKTPPNVVVILADDQGWGDLAINGNSAARTPHIDSLARQGARFDRFFVQPVCAPTRAEFLTGRWHPRGGVYGVSTGGERLDLDERTIADIFRKAGYATGCFGKWHNGSQYPYHPLGRGFDTYYGFTSGHWGDYFSPPLDLDGQPTQGNGYLTDDITGKAIDFVGRNTKSGKPFFCYLALNTPHSPMQVPEPYWKRYQNKTLLPVDGTDAMHSRAALAMGENIDDNVGRLLAELTKRGIDSNTIVVYFSDNGPNGIRYNGGMRGIKGTTDEGGTRSALHARWPGHIPAGTVVTPVGAAIDLLPTLAELARIPVDSNKPLDGISLAPAILGVNSLADCNRVLYQHWAGKTSARNQTHRLDSQGRLYHLATDPGQKTDIKDREPDTHQQLTNAVTEWRRTVLRETPLLEIRPFTVGYSALPRAVLPARDGVPHGGIKRSAPAPNCSYFTRWTQPADSMTWQVEIHEAGQFEAVLHYACPAVDIGSAIQLACGKSAWKGTIAMAHDPPARGAENDRVPRKGESLVKDFKTMSLGMADLAAGPAVLDLRATRVAGSQVAEIRAVELILRK